MIIKGKSISDADYCGKHVLNTEKNERVVVCEIRGVLADNLSEALLEMEAIAKGTKAENPLYHAKINPAPGEVMTPERWERSADLLEEKLGLTGHARVIVEHEKKGRTHRHVVWSRVNPDTLKVPVMRHDYLIHAEVELRLALEFGHKVTPRNNISEATAKKIILEYVPPDEVNDYIPPKPSAKGAADYEYINAERTGVDLHEFRSQIREIKANSDSAIAFMAGLKQAGVTLCRGRRGFMLLDPGGGEHELARTLGIRADEARKFMSGTDRLALPSVEAARAVQKAQVAAGVTPEVLSSKRGRKASRKPRNRPEPLVEAIKQGRQKRANSRAREAQVAVKRERLARLVLNTMNPPPSRFARLPLANAFNTVAARQARAAALGLKRDIRADTARDRAAAEVGRRMAEAGQRAPAGHALSNEEIAALYEAQRQRDHQAREAERHARIDGRTAYDRAGRAVGHLELQADGSVKVIYWGGSRPNPSAPSK